MYAPHTANSRDRSTILSVLEVKKQIPVLMRSVGGLKNGSEPPGDNSGYWVHAGRSHGLECALVARRLSRPAFGIIPWLSRLMSQNVMFH